MGLEIWINWFGSQDLISAFGSEDLDIWVCISGIIFMGLGLRVWISGLGCLDFNLWVWMSGFGSMGLGLRIWIYGLGLRIWRSKICSQDIDV